MRIEDSGLRFGVSGRAIYVSGTMVGGLELKFDGSGHHGRIPACRHQKLRKISFFDRHEHLDLLTLIGEIDRLTSKRGT